MHSISESTVFNAEVTKLHQFLDAWDKNYNNAIKDISLFNSQLTKVWSKEQKVYFAKIFYHARGHFHDFLWHMGNFAPDAKAKALIVENIIEEFGENRPSHEQLYFDFAASVGADLNTELNTEENYFPFLRKFNKGHLEWLRAHDWITCMAAFSAYERLDNIDYNCLLQLVIGFGISETGLVFFKAHRYAKHFEYLSDELKQAWQISEDKVSQAFDFIFNHQIKMWQELSRAVFNLI